MTQNSDTPTPSGTPTSFPRTPAVNNGTRSATTTLKPRRRWWRFFLQFSLRSLLLVTTLAAVGCWWFLQPPTREEELAGKHLKLRRQVKLVPRERGVAVGNVTV